LGVIINLINLLLLAKILAICSIVILFISITKPLFIKYNWLDHSNERKRHIGSIPLNGGVSMFIGLCFAITFIFKVDINYFLILSSFLILILGLIDDISELTPNTRIFAQLMICLIIFSYGLVQIHSFGDIFGLGVLHFDRLSLIITVLALMAGMNSFNLIDGIDGLSSGIAIVAFSAILYLANRANVIQIFNLALIYVSILIPFFCINISNKKVFMGDSGSLFIGLSIAWLLIESSQGLNPFIKPVTALWIFAVPLFDIVTVIALRLLVGSSPFTPDEKHVHFQLINIMNLNQKQAMILLVLISALIALTGVLLQIREVSESIMFYSITIILFIYLMIAIIFTKK
jgi:UDP-GlcNAc:undecaprenyl-phosphate/decaprenyl-phosphate GlcNAc-1-phosphate transferase